MTSGEVVVIGAGPAGLAVSACLRRERLAHTVLEREATVGASWRRHYDRLHLHTVKQHSALPFTPWPADADRYPSRQAVVMYLERYAHTHGVRPELGVEVRRLARTSEGLVLETSRGTLTPRVVVVATGLNAEPVRPHLNGLDRFDGLVVHSAEYRNPDPFRGRRVLVIGCGNSGAEIALDLADAGVDVTMAVRGPAHVVPRDLWGRAAQETAILLSPLPVAVRDAVSSIVLRAAVGDLSPWGLARPDVGLNALMERRGRVPLLDIGTIAAVKAKQIGVVPAILDVTAGAVRFIDGQTRPVDAIVLATGYRAALDRWIDASLLSATETSPRDTADVYFIGFHTRSTGALRDIAREAPRIARSVRAALSAPAL